MQPFRRTCLLLSLFLGATQAHAHVPPRLSEALESLAGRVLTHSLGMTERKVLALSAAEKAELRSGLENARRRFAELFGDHEAAELFARSAVEGAPARWTESAVRFREILGAELASLGLVDPRMIEKGARAFAVSSHGHGRSAAQGPRLLSRLAETLTSPLGRLLVEERGFDRELLGRLSIPRQRELVRSIESIRRWRNFDRRYLDEVLTPSALGKSVADGDGPVFLRKLDDVFADNIGFLERTPEGRYAIRNETYFHGRPTAHFPFPAKRPDGSAWTPARIVEYLDTPFGELIAEVHKVDELFFGSLNLEARQRMIEEIGAFKHALGGHLAPQTVRAGFTAGGGAASLPAGVRKTVLARADQWLRSIPILQREHGGSYFPKPPYQEPWRSGTTRGDGTPWIIEEPHPSSP